ncbi:dihydrofolate reductase family protein (plasmid) [Deinococcus sp. KNUC1210]|uniref:dihydrofolate reductase family protein n=1 Tax=Deinococcus sp. KNUC1210 TaxID=2917691 RepID=UPI001EF01BDB|nr:dihydrofolate reductase family protein [Deinococcus sp. KNUC1210]ULH16978.1 dihydrofolate reductase family protein [Deinococcus sp. KNUC1210]
MRKVIVTEFLTLDGVYEEALPWRNGYHPDDGAFKRDELFESSALLLGRVTYQGFAKYWPQADDTGTFGERMNSLPKFVATTTLTTLEWNATALEGDVVSAVTALKQQEGDNLLVYGSGTLVQTLLRAGLVDELRLMVFPLILGSGKRLFPDGEPLPLTLTASRDLGSGVLLLTYEPVIGTRSESPA